MDDPVIIEYYKHLRADGAGDVTYASSDPTRVYVASQRSSR